MNNNNDNNNDNNDDDNNNDDNNNAVITIMLIYIYIYIYIPIYYINHFSMHVLSNRFHVKPPQKPWISGPWTSWRFGLRRGVRWCREPWDDFFGILRIYILYTY